MVATACLIIVLGCVSRYQLNIGAKLGTDTHQLKVLTSEFVMDAQLGAYPDETLLLPANGSVLLVTFQAFAEQSEEREQVLRFDESLRYRTYIQLPEKVTRDTLSLRGSSVVEMIGRYSLDRSLKLYRPDFGTMVIDSVAGSRLFATLSATYRNVEGNPLQIEGQFKARFR